MATTLKQFFKCDTTLDRASALYPLTIQNAMWLLFFAGLGDVCVRFLRGGNELGQMHRALLPEDEETIGLSLRTMM